ncbi:drug/metabolite transporter (DMT) superfamily permease [Rahnella aquatilis CIP 78.65 = ATCC 33071]|uniref:Threonine/homoserine exporter RhtA n=1 Tax=Rahnella aquatilis (strain ATCC 33071 / DSM 4594 / JCM 1683 / NBRC 105701 / NCIMB 13365 / CIP 78.65) TaxID=745277 RepID=H2IXU1_RAHAC|nr:DMT family transporter [Rahnella aquatilis]AEX51966.1 putative permease, DMT superfamily [Rahnella aquatilis CIP 78.65 = ATCC 33071]KFD14901.1 drug/metabolite transporter (DMT) superfamily permease [Rahnella aquatilis CIP 78.65 = ATCC 33071]
MMITPRERMTGVLAVVFASFLWGTTGTAATFAPEVSPLAIGAVAMGLGGLLQALISASGMVASRATLLKNWRMLLTGALAVAVYPLAFYASMHLAGVTVGTVISLGSAPLLSALIEYYLDGQRLSRRWMTGAAMGVAGMALLCIGKSTGHAAAGQGDYAIAGVALGLIAGLTYALYSWAARHLMQRGVPSRAAMGATFGLGGVLLMPVLLVTGAPLLASWNNALVGAYMALIPMFVGYVCFGYALARIPASMATTLTLLEPAVAAVLAAVIVGERLSPVGWTGIGLVVACLIFITVPLKRRAALPVSA